jgi:heme-degrading monooxygenase HmoA
MHARLNRIDATSERVDDAARRAEEVLLPLLRELDGFQGFTVLADRSTGTQVAISYWESEDAMRASEAAVSQPRKDAVEAAGGQPDAVIVERYEVLLHV